MPIPTHLDRDELLPRTADAAAPARPAATDDTAVHDLSELWRDLGGSD